MDFNFLPERGSFTCVSHNFVLDEKGHECSCCGVREEIVHGQKFVIDPSMPKDEIHLVQDGLVVGRIVNVQ
jgi:hypothetical protein